MDDLRGWLSIWTRSLGEGAPTVWSACCTLRLRRVNGGYQDPGGEGLKASNGGMAEQAGQPQLRHSGSGAGRGAKKQVMEQGKVEVMSGKRVMA